MEGFEYDVYEYFGELEYGSDSYWDARMKHLNSVGLGEKRKSAQEEDTEGRVVKKRRKDGGRGDVHAADPRRGRRLGQSCREPRLPAYR